MGSAIYPDRRQVFVSTERRESVAVIGVASHKLVRIIGNLRAAPWGIRVSPDGCTIYTANGPSDDVSVVDVETGRIERRIRVGGRPWGLVVGSHQ
jgi:YVTN family beta-propeller protein